MDNKLIRRLLVGAILISLVSSPAAFAIGAWATLADAIWDVEGSQEAATFGHSVSATGDFDNDGYADVVIGTHLYSYDPGSGPVYRSGGAWLFYGSATGPSATADLFLVPPQLKANGYFGQALAIANFDGDEYDDLVIGLTNYTQSHSDEGAVYVYYGSDTGIDGSHDWVARGANTYAHFGLAVSSAGDIDNDGSDDLIVGARRYDSCNGALPIINHAYVFMGSGTGLGADKTAAQADWYAMGDQCTPNNDAGFGMNVGSAGDVNGDGYDDVFVGAAFQDSGQTDEGKVFVWHSDVGDLGDPGTPSNADWTVESDQADGHLPNYTRTAVGSGDFNGDGYGDFIVGTRFYDHMEAYDGIAMAFYGADTVGLGDNGTPANADWFAYGAEASDQLGSNLVVLDYNGDSFDDVLIGGLAHTVGTESAAGMALIWFGTEDGLSAGGPSNYADWMAEGNQATSYFGWSLSAGDTNDDGYEDMIIGAPSYDLVTTDEGRVWAFRGEPTVFIENFETGDSDRCSYTVQ